MAERFTVADLRAAIAELPDDAPLFVQGYEGGYADMTSPAPVKVTLNYHDTESWWNGPHDDPDADTTTAVTEGVGCSTDEQA